LGFAFVEEMGQPVEQNVGLGREADLEMLRVWVFWLWFGGKLCCGFWLNCGDCVSIVAMVAVRFIVGYCCQMGLGSRNFCVVIGAFVVKGGCGWLVGH